MQPLFIAGPVRYLPCVPLVLHSERTWDEAKFPRQKLEWVVRQRGAVLYNVSPGSTNLHMLVPLQSLLSFAELKEDLRTVADLPIDAVSCLHATIPPTDLLAFAQSELASISQAPALSPSILRLAPSSPHTSAEQQQQQQQQHPPASSPAELRSRVDAACNKPLDQLTDEDHQAMAEYRSWADNARREAFPELYRNDEE